MTVQYLPNFGRPAKIQRPIDLDHLFRDADVVKSIYLQVSYLNAENPGDYHWAIVWDCGKTIQSSCQAQRRINVVRELNAPHLTNWGALTKTVQKNNDETFKEIFIAYLKLADRQKLEEIGNATEVVVPNGEWNCQDWIITVFQIAEKQHLITNAQWSGAVAAARALYLT